MVRMVRKVRRVRVRVRRRVGRVKRRKSRRGRGRRGEGRVEVGEEVEGGRGWGGVNSIQLSHNSIPRVINTICKLSS